MSYLTYPYVFRGILSMSWCPEDPDLLISCGKDNRILVWNPSSENDVILNLFIHLIFVINT